MSYPENFRCLDCGVCTGTIDEYYMVKAAVWTQATQGKPNGMLCIGCLEARIGRRLQPSDFSEHMGRERIESWNPACKVSKRLADRLGWEVR